MIIQNIDMGPNMGSSSGSYITPKVLETEP